MRKLLLKFAKRSYAVAVVFTKDLISLLSCILFSSFKSAKKLKNLNKKIGSYCRDCYILGNGPALKEALKNLPDQSKTDFFVVNMFANQDIFFDLKPKNYIIIDPYTWDYETHPFLDSSADLKVFQQNAVNLQKALARVDWNMNLFVPNGCPKRFTDKLSPSINVIHINTTPVDGSVRLSHFLYKHGLGMPFPMNVTNAAVYVAIMLRYPRTYLYGANHSWLKDYDVDENNRIFLNDNHFYDKSRKYIKKGCLQTSLKCMSIAFFSHDKLDNFSREMGVRVYNRTKGSFIDAYEFDC